MKSTCIMPHEFIIFLWLPFQTPEGTGKKAQDLIDRCSQEGWPFRLRVKLPAEPGSLFPLKFAWQRTGREGGAESRSRKHCSKNISEADLSTFDMGSFGEDEQEETLPDLFEEWPVICEQTLSDESANADACAKE